MEDFKQYLSEGADDREREAAEKVHQGLAGLRLENKVAEVAAERRALLRHKFKIRLTLLIAAFALIAGVAFWYVQSGAQVVEKKPDETPVQQTIANEDQPSTAPQTPNKPTETLKQQGPIAQNNVPEKLPAQRFPSPNIRGENSEDKALKTLLDQVWDTDYPQKGLQLSSTFDGADRLLQARDFSAAYIQLQRLERKMPANDTLRLLKGHCLLEMGEGTEAIRYFNGLETKHADWAMRLDWYRGLAMLLQGDKQEARRIFGKISTTPSHAYHKQAGRAVQLMK